MSFAPDVHDRPSAKALVTSLFETWTTNDLARACTLVDEDGPAWLAHAAGAHDAEPNLGTELTLRRWISLLQGVLDQMPEGLQVLVHRMVCEGEWVVAEVESRGALTDGRVYKHYTFWFEVQDGVIRGLRQFFDTKYGEQFFPNAHFQVPS